jgi:heterodisulfide reductase subunit B
LLQIKDNNYNSSQRGISDYHRPVGGILEQLNKTLSTTGDHHYKNNYFSKSFLKYMYRENSMEKITNEKDAV